MKRALVAASLCCAACAPGYGAGALAATAPTHDVRVVGCLEVAAELAYDGVTPQERPADAPIVRIALGNTCDEATPVHFERLVFVGVWPDGTRAALRPYDPREEIVPAVLGARASATEKLMLQSGEGAPDFVCTDVSNLGDRPERVRPMCRPFRAFVPPPDYTDG